MPVWFKGAAGLMLGLLQLGLISVLVTHPHVQPMYRDFFILGTRDCWLPDAEIAPTRKALAARSEIDPTALSPTAACYLFTNGWGGGNASFVWSIKQNATIDLPVPAGAHRLILRFKTMAHSKDQELQFQLDGRFAGRLTIPATADSASVSLDLPAQHGADLTIQIFTRSSSPIALSGIRWTD